MPESHFLEQPEPAKFGASKAKNSWFHAGNQVHQTRDWPAFGCNRVALEQRYYRLESERAGIHGGGNDGGDNLDVQILQLTYNPRRVRRIINRLPMRREVRDDARQSLDLFVASSPRCRFYGRRQDIYEFLGLRGQGRLQVVEVDPNLIDQASNSFRLNLRTLA